MDQLLYVVFGLLEAVIYPFTVIYPFIDKDGRLAARIRRWRRQHRR